MSTMETSLEPKELLYEMTVFQKTEDLAPIKKIFTKHKAVILNEKPIQKIKLAYQIKKQQFCFMCVLEFQADPSSLDVLSKELRHEEDMLRFVMHHAVSRKDAHSVSQRPSPQKRIGMHLRKIAETVLTNEALEKKIEEISQ